MRAPTSGRMQCRPARVFCSRIQSSQYAAGLHEECTAGYVGVHSGYVGFNTCIRKYFTIWIKCIHHTPIPDVNLMLVINVRRNNGANATARLYHTRDARQPYYR